MNSRWTITVFRACVWLLRRLSKNILCRIQQVHFITPYRFFQRCIKNGQNDDQALLQWMTISIKSALIHKKVYFGYEKSFQRWGTPLRGIRVTCQVYMALPTILKVAQDSKLHYQQQELLSWYPNNMQPQATKIGSSKTVEWLSSDKGMQRLWQR